MTMTNPMPSTNRVEHSRILAAVASYERTLANVKAAAAARRRKTAEAANHWTETGADRPGSMELSAR
jgi:hypothetical protein